MQQLPKESTTDARTLAHKLNVAFHEQPVEVIILCAFGLGSLSTLIVTRLHARYVRRIPSVDWVTPDIFAKKRWIKGIVTNVGDPDNFRLYHTPGLGWHWPFKLRRIPSRPKDLKDQTLHIRIAGVDAPEAAHFGKPAQMFANEAMAWMKNQVESKTVYCNLISRDQYSRIVAIVMTPKPFLPSFLTPRFGRNISIEMLRAGWATTYEQSGAVYGKWGKQAFLDLEEAAKSAKRGQWIHGMQNESPADYKRRYAQASQRQQLDSGKSGAEEHVNTKYRNWFERLWSK